MSDNSSATGTAPAFDPTTERGVHNPRVIDLIAPSEDGAGVVLTMMESRPWRSDPKQLEQLQEKFNNYLDYAIDGYLVQQYPQYQGRKVFIELQIQNPPDAEIASLLEAMERYALSIGIVFRTNHSARHR